MSFLLVPVDSLDEESHGYEVAARLPDDDDAAGVPEEAEAENEENAPDASNHSKATKKKKRLFGLSVVATFVVMAVGVAWSIKSQASSNTMAVSKQAAVAT